MNKNNVRKIKLAIIKKTSDKKIGDKITKAILLITFSSCIITGLLGIFSCSTINGSAKKLYSDNLIPLSRVYKVQDDFLTISIKIRDMALDKRTNYSSDADQLNSLIQDMTNQVYKNKADFGNENADYEKMQTDVTKYNGVIEAIENDIQSGELGQAKSLLDGDGATISKQLDSKINKVFSDNAAMAKARNQTDNTIFIIVVSAVVALVTAFILLSFRLSKRVARKISDPINKMVISADSIAKGNLNVDLNIDTGDETGILAEAFKKIVESLRSMEADVNMLISQAVEGKLDTRADTSRHEGDYREIIEGVNEMLDTVKAPLDVASDYINSLADGVIQNDIENTYKGYYATLIDNLNHVSHSMSILLRESQKLDEAGLNGNLDVRGDESKLKGFYAGIIHGVNSTFDSIKAPLDVASEFIGKLASGTSTEPLKNAYKGYYAKLIDNLNDVLSSLLTLQEESQKLAQAGQNGELGYRGDASKAKGFYADLLNGMNGIFEAVAAPLNESKIVLGKMAMDDYTSEMSFGYKGSLKEFAKSINLLRKMLLYIEKVVTEVSHGSFASLDEMKKTGKHSENDKMMPSLIMMTQSINDLIEDAGKMASAAIEGDLGKREDESKFEGGYRQIIHGMNMTMEAFSVPIEESAHVLEELAQGNLAVSVAGEYKGKYNTIKASLNQAIATLNSTICNINLSAYEVATGSKQISDASQSLSQGSAEQANTVEELTSSITEVASQTKQNAASAAQASEISTTVKAEAARGNEKMAQLLNSMSKINEASTDISKIIKVIDSIAFQTNILALNAAVEAARAGQYGKGFAVVAEEVRNLAGKSAQAVTETTALIENSINKVGSGTKIANETAGMLDKIVQISQKSAALVGNIAAASNEQAAAIAQIDTGILQVSTVVQTNSATSEECAASSEELSGQADVLNKLVAKFKLTDAQA